MRKKEKKKGKCPKFIVINVVIAIILLVTLSALTLNWLNSYTLHEHSISVPTFQSLSIEDAKDLAKSQQLQIIILDSIYDTNSPHNSVIEQYPMSGQHVKPNRTIYLTINASTPKKIPVPDIRNAPFRQTMRLLKSYGFQIGKLIYTPSSYKNLVLNLRYDNEDISSGTELYKGSIIDIVLGKGNGHSIVPNINLLGEKTNQAINILKENHLNIGDVIGDSTVINNYDKANAVVFQQSPDYKLQAQITAGSYITLYITTDTVKLNHFLNGDIKKDSTQQQSVDTSLLLPENEETDETPKDLPPIETIDEY
ncbi:MAG: PASTA domain-containing protein [Culturomica sp.]|nr:PASTA domain-containing protein [Culturomica sp.]